MEAQQRDLLAVYRVKKRQFVYVQIYSSYFWETTFLAEIWYRNDKDA